MSAASLISHVLLDAVPGDRPAGEDLRWTPEWDRIKEARRSDDALKLEKWIKKEHKSANWNQVLELTAAALAERSKDLQLAVWFTEAGLKVHGWAGLRDGLRLIRELIERYWDEGLFPAIEDGPEDRAGPLEWLNGKLVDEVTAISITARSGDSCDNYSYTDLIEARRVGSEASTRTPEGEVDEVKKKQFDAALKEGRTSLDMFDRAVKDSKRADAEALAALVGGCATEFAALEKIVEERYGNAVPSLSAFRNILRDVQQEVANIVEKKRRDEPDALVSGAAAESSQAAAPAVILRMPLTTAAPGGSASSHSWEEAEQIIRSGQVDQGLAEMTRLAAAETSGRERFRRKLLLAEVCLGSGRERLARSILEQLAEQIDKNQLEHWESSELIGSVWTRLYELYKSRDADSDKAKNLYERLCRLDPWQALKCRET